MLPKSQLQFIKSLHQKKFRKEHGFFIVEGLKSITEFLYSDYVIHSIYYLSKVEPKIDIFPKNIKHYLISEKELAAISSLKTPQGILAIIYLPPQKEIDENLLKNTFSLVLDNVQDPGNLGTVIRTADWFGVPNIICSLDTVEAFNPKVVQATMGSLAHIALFYTDLSLFLAKTSIPVYAALLTGESIYKTTFGNEGLILLGNEGNGINKSLIMEQTKGITIPRFGKAESLNVAISAAIFCSEIKRLLR
ncbi:RNA methyltransferase [Olivibacter ginsenosidimutans]|uniref:RNA methyltransferase n=1 Tax=Olivibacter ginsenosidimutans TaxID=1176537 RepID=A0ABP9B3K6_9SPHI